MATTEKQQTVLVPVDFSPHSESAVVCAMEMAEMLGLPLTVLHVVHDLADAPGYYSVKGSKKQLLRLEDVAKEMLNEFMDEMKKKYPERAALEKTTALLVAGLPVNRILEIAEETNARMIVMGSQGRTGLQRLMLGSKAEQVVRLSPISVLIVKVPDESGHDTGEQQ